MTASTVTLASMTTLAKTYAYSRACDRLSALLREAVNRQRQQKGAADRSASFLGRRFTPR